MIQILKSGKFPDPLPYHMPLLNLYSLYYLTFKYQFLTLYLSLKQVPILCSKTPPPWGGGSKISKPRGPMGWGIWNSMGDPKHYNWGILAILAILIFKIWAVNEISPILEIFTNWGILEIWGILAFWSFWEIRAILKYLQFLEIQPIFENCGDFFGW